MHNRIMQSNCGVDTVKSARQTPTMIESDPPAGFGGRPGPSIGEPNAIAIDIGGTTAKCGLITKGEVGLNTNYLVDRSETSAGYPVMVPVVDLVEIGNGGGSIAWVDEFQRLHVGPQSAGAKPQRFPMALAARRRRPPMPTWLWPHQPGLLRAWTMLRRYARSRRRIGPASQNPTPGRHIVARSILRIANNNMVNAIKLIREPGHDPRDFTLFAFGVGGGLHACALAKAGIQKAIIPSLSGCSSAWGMLLSDLRRDYLQTQIVELSGPDVRPRSTI